MSGCVNMKETYLTSIYEEFKALIEMHRGEIIEFGRELFTCPELGFKEVKSNEILTSFFVENGISFKNDILTVALDFTDLPASVSFYDTGNNRIEKYEGGMGEYYFENPSDSIISIYISGKNKIPYMVEVKKSEIKDIEEPIAFICNLFDGSWRTFEFYFRHRFCWCCRSCL